MMDAFYCAREAWRDQRDQASNGHATEGREFAELSPPPRLQDFMVLQGHH